MRNHLGILDRPVGVISGPELGFTLSVKRSHYSLDRPIRSSDAVFHNFEEEFACGNQASVVVELLECMD